MQRVKDGFSLLWPNLMVGQTGNHARGKPGYIVDETHPLEVGYDEDTGETDFDGAKIMRRVKGWLEGQEHKLCDLKDYDKPVASVLENPQAIALMREWKQKKAGEKPAPKPKRVRKKIKENTAKADEPALDIPEPEE